MPTVAEQQFHRECGALIARLAREISYNATIFARMVSEHGGVSAAKRLLAGRHESDGFSTLYAHDRLGQSVEAMVLLSWFAELFTTDERRIARQRLTDANFDVDAFLARASNALPQWYGPEE